MIRTTRINSGFDIELQFGAEWFVTAIQLLIDKKVIDVLGLQIIIQDVNILMGPDWDLEIWMVGDSTPILAKAALNDDGSILSLSFNNPLIPPKDIPFGALSNLAGKPALVKVAGDDDHEDAICILGNLKLQTPAQDEEPLTADELNNQTRGDAGAAISFLPKDQDIAFGMGQSTYRRFANNIWHTQLRAEDGSHPLPDAANKKGDWHKVKVWGEDGSIKIKLEGEVPIDIWPDADVTITLSIKPAIKDGKIIITIETDTDVDTGILGDIFAFVTGGIAGGIVGGIIGFIAAIASGGLLLPVIFTGVAVGASVGAALGVITLEIAEVVVEGIVQKIIAAKVNGEPVGEIHCREEGIVQLATPKKDGGFDLSVIGAMPTAIPIHEEDPVNERLYHRTLLVTSNYEEIKVNGSGFAASGISGIQEKFTPKLASLVEVSYNGEELQTLTYRRPNGRQQMLTKVEVLERARAGELKAPFKMYVKPDKADLRIAEGQIPCVCLTPVAIHQIDTIVDEIEFENGLRMKVPDVIELQDASALVVIGYQLIHPRDYNAYYRAKADFFLDNNLESLPTYDE